MKAMVNGTTTMKKESGVSEYFEPMYNVAICTPTAGLVKATYTASLIGMVGWYLQTPIEEDDERNVSYTLLIGSHIAQQREEMVEQAISDPSVTHVLFIDDDMGFQADCLNLALSRKKAIVLANYRKKNPPWSFTARKLTEDMRAVEVATDDLVRGLEPISFGGFGFCLIAVDVLKQMPKPRFLPQWIEHQQRYSTEDYPFFKAVQDLGLAEVYVDHDLSKKVLHIGDYTYMYGATPMKVKKSIPQADAVQEFKAA